MKNLFFCKNGSLTSYALHCGYVERSESLTKYKKLYIENGCINVKSGTAENPLSIWECFDKLSEARKFYNSIKL